MRVHYVIYTSLYIFVHKKSVYRHQEITIQLQTLSELIQLYISGCDPQTPFAEVKHRTLRMRGWGTEVVD